MILRPLLTQRSAGSPLASAVMPGYNGVSELAAHSLRTPETNNGTGQTFGGGGGGNSGNFYTAAADPGVVSALLAQYSGSSANAAGLYDNLENILVGLGDPQLAAAIQQRLGLNNQTANLTAAATQSGNSTLGQLNLAAAQAYQKTLNDLASGGFSGRLGYTLNAENQQNAQNQFKQEQTAYGQMQSAINKNLSGDLGLRNAVTNAVLRATQNNDLGLSKITNPAGVTSGDLRASVPSTLGKVAAPTNTQIGPTTTPPKVTVHKAAPVLSSHALTVRG